MDGGERVWREEDERWEEMTRTEPTLTHWAFIWDGQRTNLKLFGRFVPVLDIPDRFPKTVIILLSRCDRSPGAWEFF